MDVKHWSKHCNDFNVRYWSRGEFNEDSEGVSSWMIQHLRDGVRKQSVSRRRRSAAKFTRE